MACAGSRLLPELARKSPGAFMCPATQKVFVAGTKRRYRRRLQGQSKRKKTLVRRCPSGAVEQTGCHTRLNRNATTSCTSLAGVPLMRLQEQPIETSGSTANGGPTSLTAGSKTKFGSRSTGVLPVLPSLPLAAVAESASTDITDTSHKKAAFAIAASPTSNDEVSDKIGIRFRGGDHRDVGGARQVRKHSRGDCDECSSGRVKIWCCPTTSSLREEACADLAGMARPRLWRTCIHPPSEKNAGYVELERLKERFKASRKAIGPKRQVAGAKLKLDFLSVLRAEMSEEVRERWMQRRALMRADRFTVEQRRELRDWFDCLDKDGSGEIDSSELSHPLLCTGLARSALEVGRLVRQVDRDGSGEIGFKEFLAIFQPKGETAAKSAVDKIVHLQEVKKAYGSDMQTVVATERRSLLIKEVLDEAAFRSSVAEEVAEQRYIAESNGDSAVLRTLREKEAKLERRRVKKNLFIQAVSDATDFKQERERLRDTALQEADRRRQIRRNRARAAGVGFLLPAGSSLKLNATCSATPMTGSVSEPGFVTASRLETRNLGRSVSQVGSATGVRGEENLCGSGAPRVITTSATAAETIRGSEARTLLAREEQHLLQRRGHHHNFKKTASATNFDGNGGASGTVSSSLRLVADDDTVYNSGRNGDIRGLGPGDSITAASGPVTVTASLQVYTARGLAESTPEPGGEMVGTSASPFLLGGKGAITEGIPSQVPGGEAGGHNDSSSRGSSVCRGLPSPLGSAQGKRRSQSSSSSSSSSICQDGVDRAICGPLGENVAIESDIPPIGECRIHDVPPGEGPSRLSGHALTKVAAAGAAQPEAMVATPRVSVGASLSERDGFTPAAAPHAPGRCRPTPNRGGIGVTTGPMDVRAKLPRQEPGLDWYRHSKLSAVATSADP